ncbi:S8 family peptidase [Altererythrobacter sp. MF3-039]|uniref:S8 family peptidase n=1 Tax=Altererythrobacter sp. MF3-039 TaxID=3252901 RepID=UPI00390C8343
MKQKLATTVATIAIMASLGSTASAQETSANASGEVGGAVFSTKSLDGATSSEVIAYADTVDPQYRNIDPFYRDINAFWKNISPFYRDINAFWKNISPFYGDISAFWGNVDANWKNIGAFDAEYLAAIGTFWQETSLHWSATNETWSLLEANSGDPLLAAQVQAMLNDLVARSDAQWGAAVTAETGLSFEEGFAADVLARHGIDLNDPATLAGMTAVERNLFFLDWHDSLMTYAGFDHVDHWMGAVNWTPAVTQQQGAGADAVIGIIDANFSADPDLADNLVWSGGDTAGLNGHGAAVASLIAAAHDGEGVMGIAPNTTITAFNPFDATGSATWDDVATGILSLKSNNNSALNNVLGQNVRASVINLSLGEPGWMLAPGLAEVFSRPAVAAHNMSTVYVVAAGNDGIVQLTDVEWDFRNETAVIFVGSVNPMGEISYFSNQPGSTCLLDNGVCHEGNELYLRTVVAPGEMLLTSDGMGGLTRSSGTSFAAPLVSGAISLLHDRWPWLTSKPQETTEIIFRSARDLGAPGPDPVYGWGMLDVTASQAPLDFNTMRFVLYQKRGRMYRSYNISASELITSGIPNWWESDDVWFDIYEDIGTTFRDFLVPMSTAAQGRQYAGLQGGREYMQEFVAERFSQWILSGGTDSNGDGVAGFSQIRSTNSKFSSGWALTYDAILPQYTETGSMQPIHTAATLSDPSATVSLTLGHGQGAMAIAGGNFGRMQDFDRNSGGVNPVLGFASGEAFAKANYKLGLRTTIGLGFSENRQSHDEIKGLTQLDLATLFGRDAHTADALTFDIEHRAAKNVTLGAQWTRLREDNALLGVQTNSSALLGSGSRTDAVTLSASVDLGRGLTFDASATGGLTATADGNAINSLNRSLSTAAQITVGKQGLFGSHDALRVSVAQPLKIESGSVELRSLTVVDRQTGELGEKVHEFNIETKRRVVGEALYAAPISRMGELAIFGRYESEGNFGVEESYIVGGSVNMRF